ICWLREPAAHGSELRPGKRLLKPVAEPAQHAANGLLRMVCGREIWCEIPRGGFGKTGWPGRLVGGDRPRGTSGLDALQDRGGSSDVPERDHCGIAACRRTEWYHPARGR